MTTDFFARKFVPQTSLGRVHACEFASFKIALDNHFQRKRQSSAAAPLRVHRQCFYKARSTDGDDYSTHVLAPIKIFKYRYSAYYRADLHYYRYHIHSVQYLDLSTKRLPTVIRVFSLIFFLSFPFFSLQTLFSRHF